ncbi:MAG: hypothetical protein IPO91_00940 [Chloroflexi bacterium]|nr:hypothetical protein [Chloroflexota bacterium]
MVAEETGADARTAHITLYHDANHPSYLELPIVATTSAPVTTRAAEAVKPEM